MWMKLVWILLFFCGAIAILGLICMIALMWKENAERWEKTLKEKEKEVLEEEGR